MKYKVYIIVLSTALAISIIGNAFQYVTNHKAKEQSANLESNIANLTENITSLESDIAAGEAELLSLTEQISELQLTVDAYENQKEKYWTLAVDDYKISLQEGAEEDTLDLIYYKDDVESLLLSLQKGNDYQTPEDISAEAFEECLGHSGFRLYRRHPLGSFYYYEVDYYAIEEDLELLAYRWGSKDEGFYEVDVDGDGIEELICNVMWMADGATDVFIYHFNGEKVLKGFGSNLLDEPFDNYGLGSIYTEYLPDKNKVHISYWQDAIQDYQEKDYDIDLSKLELSDFIK